MYLPHCQGLARIALVRKARSPKTAAGHTPDKLPDPFLIDSEHFVQELARIRSLALAVPMSLETYGPTNTIVDALWRLEEQLRYLLRLHREGQRAFAQKHALQALSAAPQAVSLPDSLRNHA
jgi:hypothetical protein